MANDAADVANVFGRFEAHRHSLELGFATVFVLLALTMLFSAIWLGLAFANRLVGPIRRLIRATDEVASGNLHVQVPTRRSDGDLGHLGETFNKMTSELLRQQTGLIDANALNDERRAFIEAVLSGVPGRRSGRRQRRRHHDFKRRSRAAAWRRSRSDRAASERRPAQHRIDLGTGAIAAVAAPSRAGDRPARRSRAGSQRPGDRKPGAGRSRQRHHPRRHQRPGDRPAHRRVGGCGASHRPRDQESADPDPALGRAAEATLRAAYSRGQGGVRPMHGHHHPAGRRHQTNGRRILLLRPHAQGAAGERRPHRLCASGDISDAGRPSGHRFRGQTSR